MAEKLAEATWVAFTKLHKLELDDAPLRKALAKVDKSGAAAPRLQALEELTAALDKQLAALPKRRKELGDKVFGEAKAKLQALLEQAGSQAEAEAESQAKAARAAAAAAAAEEDEADAPALLGSRMLPLLRELRKGGTRMHAMICVAGKATVVLIMRRAIPPARFKLLVEQLDSPAGAKRISAECQYESGALTFIVQASASGLAKRLRLALLAQTELRLKVRVRGEDGEQDEDGDEGEGSVAEPGGAAAAGPAAAATATATADGAGTAQPPSPAQLAYEQRLARVHGPVQQALAGQHPESSRLRALIAMAVEKADVQRDYAAATLALQGIEKLLAQAAGPAKAGTATRADLAERLKQVMLLGKERMAADESLRARLLPAITAAKAALDAGDGARCAVLLQALEARLAAGGSAGQAPSGLVAKRGFILERWRKLPAELSVELGDLLQAVVAQLPHEDAAGFGKALERKLAGLTGSMQQRIDDAIDSAINAGDPRYGAVASTIATLRQEVAAHRLIVLLRESALASAAGVERAYLAALDEVERALT
jgi:hypothetical protein